MRKIDLWESDGLLDETIERGAIASEKFWGKNVAQAFVEFLGFNLDRGYRYHLYQPVLSRERTKETIRNILGASPGDPKWVGLLLYEAVEPSPLDVSWEPYDLKRLLRKIKDDQGKANSYAADAVQERLGSGAKRRDIVAEYDLEIKYLLQQNEHRLALWILGPNYVADQAIENIPRDFSKLGGIVGCWTPAAEDFELVDIIEDQDLITARVELKPKKDRVGTT